MRRIRRMGWRGVPKQLQYTYCAVCREHWTEGGRAASGPKRDGEGRGGRGGVPLGSWEGAADAAGAAGAVAGPRKALRASGPRDAPATTLQPGQRMTPAGRQRRSSARVRGSRPNPARSSGAGNGWMRNGAGSPPPSRRGFHADWGPTGARPEASEQRRPPTCGRVPRAPRSPPRSDAARTGHARGFML